MKIGEITRRGALAGAGGLTLAACSDSRPQAEPLAVAEGAFKHGVASGDPDQTSLVVWTALTGTRADAPVRVEVSADERFSELVFEGETAPAGPAVTSPDMEPAIPYKALVEGLEPGRAYMFRFVRDGEYSPVGRTRTLPDGRVDEFRIAAFSCSNYPAGFFNAYRDAAGREDVDLVVHLGDYIYEYGMDGYATEDAEALSRVPDPRREIVTADDYGRRHAQYCLDPDLQALKARAPWIAVWDDHETANDAWSRGAQNHNEGEGEWTARRDGALAAYYAWLPVRDAEPRHARQGAVTIGDLATLVLMETRLSARTEPVDWSSFPVPVDADPEDPEVAEAVQRWRDEVIGNPAREMMGEAQLAALSQTLRASREAGQPWRVLINQVMIAPKTMPDYTRQTPLWLRFAMRMIGGQVWETAQLSRFSIPMTLDDWDGFPAERERLYAAVAEADADILVLTGDTHNFWCNDLVDGQGTRRGTEFGVTSVTSPSDFEYVNAPGVDFGALTTERNAHILHHEVYTKGYVHLTLNREGAQADFVSVSDIKSRDFVAGIDSRWLVRPAHGSEPVQVERLA